MGIGTLALAADHPHGENQEKKIVVRVDDVAKYSDPAHANAMWTDGSMQVKAEIEDNHLTVYVNGDKVYETDDLESMDGDIDAGKIKIRRVGKGIVLLHDGEEILSMGGGGRVLIGGEGNDFDFDFDDIDGAEHFDADQLHELLEKARQSGGAAQFSVGVGGNNADQPPVMLGIMLSSGAEAGINLPDIDADDITLVTRVFEGLPADKAGLKSSDLIIKIDGLDSASPEALSEFLKNEEPGEEVELSVYRNGEKKKIVVELEPFDAGSLGVASGEENEDQFSFDFDEAFGRSQREMAEASERLAELAQRLNDATGRERRRLTEEMVTLGKHLSQLSAEIARKSAEGNLFFSPNQFQLRGTPDEDGNVRRWAFPNMPRFRIE